jgi:hypothetical protein
MKPPHLSLHGNQILDPIRKTPMASTSINPLNPLVGISITEKLSQSNDAMWRAQILSAVRGARLTGQLTGDAAPPAE